jgi:hypothetical protein
MQELSSLARALGSWVRIHLKGFEVCVFVFFLFVLSVVYAAALRQADHKSKDTYRTSKEDYEVEKEARPRQKTIEPLKK